MLVWTMSFTRLESKKHSVGLKLFIVVTIKWMMGRMRFMYISKNGSDISLNKNDD